MSSSLVAVLNKNTPQGKAARDRVAELVREHYTSATGYSNKFKKRSSPKGSNS